MNNQGVVNVGGTSAFGAVANSGAFNVLGTSATTVGSFTTQSGTILVQSGPSAPATLTVTNGFTSTGLIELRAYQDNFGNERSATLTVTSGPLVNETSGVIRGTKNGGQDLTSGVLNLLDAALDNRGLIDVQQYTIEKKPPISEPITGVT